MTAKKALYIAAFTVLGILMNFLLHAALEISALSLLTKNFEKYNLGLSWSEWFLVHRVGAVILLAAGIIAGSWAGSHWWRKIYAK